MTKRASPSSKRWAVAMRSSSMFYFNISINCRYVRSNRGVPHGGCSPESTRHGITASPKKGNECNLCVRYDLLFMSRVAHSISEL